MNSVPSVAEMERRSQYGVLKRKKEKQIFIEKRKEPFTNEQDQETHIVV